jgi:anti-sigma factor RsiW
MTTNDGTQHRQQLLMALLDGELTAEEAAEANTLLVRDPRFRDDFEALRKSSGKLDLLSTLEPGDEIVRALWRNPFSRLAGRALLAMVIGGYGFLVLFALGAVVADGAMPALPKIGIAAIIIGGAGLLALVGYERARLWKIDPYKHIER